MPRQLTRAFYATGPYLWLFLGRASAIEPSPPVDLVESETGIDMAVALPSGRYELVEQALNQGCLRLALRKLA